MPRRDSAITTVQSTTLRRSPRLLHKNEKTPEPLRLASIRKSPRLARQKSSSQEPKDPETPNPRTNRVRSSEFSVTVSKKSSKPSNCSRNCESLTTGSRKSLTLTNGFDSFSNLRRSPRFSDHKNIVGYESKDILSKVSKKVGESKDGSKTCENVSSGSEKSLKNNGVNGFPSHRRSQRLSNQQMVVYDEKTSGDKGCHLSSKLVSKEEVLGVNLGEKLLVKGKKSTKREAEESEVGSEVVEVSRKRKREEEDNGNVKGWTKEQELALQRAYLAAKPTPHFWKKVSKLVPGKSAQECFDKVNSDHLTPPQRHRASRAKRRTSLSPIPNLQLSASKLLKPAEVKAKKPSCNKQKSHVTQKNVRQLLRMHYNKNQDHEADLFSVLEPNLDLSTQGFPPSIIFSTPKNLQEKQRLLQNCNERSSSGHKKPLSRFSGSRGTALASPLVLKQVKNRVLHEKYIDQLHSRDAKRKAASEHSKKASLRTEDRKEIHNQKLDVVKSAKNALVSDAREAISMLQREQTNALSNSSDLDDDVFRSDDDESENGN